MQILVILRDHFRAETLQFLGVNTRGGNIPTPHVQVLLYARPAIVGADNPPTYIKSPLGGEDRVGDIFCS